MYGACALGNERKIRYTIKSVPNCQLWILACSDAWPMSTAREAQSSDNRHNGVLPAHHWLGYSGASRNMPDGDSPHFLELEFEAFVVAMPYKRLAYSCKDKFGDLMMVLDIGIPPYDSGRLRPSRSFGAG